MAVPKKYKTQAPAVTSAAAIIPSARVIIGPAVCPACKSAKVKQDKQISRQFYNDELLVAHSLQCECGKFYLNKTAQPFKAPKQEQAIRPERDVLQVEAPGVMLERDQVQAKYF